MIRHLFKYLCYIYIQVQFLTMKPLSISDIPLYVSKTSTSEMAMFIVVKLMLPFVGPVS